MAQLGLLIAGAGLLALTIVDLIWTTLTLSGAGPMTKLVTRAVSPLGRRSGLAILLATVVLWVALTWLGWWLVFASGPRAVVDSTTDEPAGAIQRAYFAGYSLITLGIGDFKPKGAAWEILTILASINGFVLVTLAVTYLLPILSAIVDERAAAMMIATMGRDPEEILRRCWTGADFGPLESRLEALLPMLAKESQRHLAYPLLRYFEGPDPSTSLVRNAAVLDDLVTLLRHGVAPEARPHPVVLDALEDVLERHAGSLGREHSRDHDLEAGPALARLREVGIPTVDGRSFRAVLRS